MSLKRKIVSAVTFLFAAVAFTTFVSAQDTTTNPTNQNDSTQKQERSERRGFGRRGGMGKMRGDEEKGDDRMMMRSLGRLNLSDAQKAQVKSTMDNFKTSTQTQRDEMRGLAMKKRDGVITADEQNRLKELKTQMRTSSEQMNNSIMAILTTEQKTRLDQMKQEMRQKMEQRRQNRLNQQQNQQTAPPQEN